MTKIYPDTYFMKYQRKILELKSNRMLFHSSTMNTSKSVYSINYEYTAGASASVEHKSRKEEESWTVIRHIFFKQDNF